MTGASGPEPRRPEQGARSTTRSRLLMAAVLAVFVAIAVGVGFLIPATSPPPATSASPSPPPVPRRADGTTPVVVSLTFDDGLAGQMQYLQTLQQHGLVGTFYVNTGDIGQPNYMTRADLAQIAAAGDEIGGHSVSHLSLPENAPDEAARQICNDRATLASWGFDPVSFAYPFGKSSPPVEAMVRDCGYTNARIDHGVGPVSAACPACVSGESVPPLDPYAIRTPLNIIGSEGPADLEGIVTRAQAAGGGWVPLIFHHESCDTCGNLSTSPEVFDQFATWLVDQQRAGTLVVRTPGQVVGGRGGPARTAPAATSTSIANADLSQPGTTVPDCWSPTGYGTNTAAFAWTPPVDGAPASETVTVSAYTDGDAVMLPRLDLGQCTAATSPGTVTHLAAQYRATVPTQFSVYRRTGTGSWEYWVSGPLVGPSADWRPIVWDTPPAPPDTTGVAAGLIVGGVGSVQSMAYVEQAVVPPSDIPPGPRGALVVGAAAAAALVLLAAVAVFTHRYRRRRRPRGGSGGVPAVPGPRPPGDDGPGEAGGDDTAEPPASEREGAHR